LDLTRRGFFPRFAGKEVLRELKGGLQVAKDHGSSVKNDKQYEGLKKKGMSKERAAKIANTSNASQKGGKKSGGKKKSN